MTASISLPRPFRQVRSSGWGAGLLLGLPAFLTVLAVVAYPIGRLTWDVVSTVGLGGILDPLRSAAERAALQRTLRVSALVAVASVALGLFVAYTLAWSRSRVVRASLWASVLAPFWMSVVVKNYAFVLLLQQQGPVTKALRSAGLLSAQGDLLYTEGAVLVGMLYAMLPYAVLVLYPSVRNVRAEQLQAAETLGAGRLRALRDVMLPATAPALLSAGTLVFVISIGFYVTPIVLGGVGSPFVAARVHEQIFEYFDLVGAKSYALLLMLTALAVFGLSRFATRFLPQSRVRGEARR
ncbi:ABC transporter permease [Actinomadura viridis]|uniref:Spermidine/putrescine transport system permease protein n=1 Tax=Actinomadura viridis TaxID=58110 RepID=A0A931DGI2_9ACTN|nr:ABC transporter permease [Actinomadura viridis]MBG6088852.1 putative spermidine/putrescine transport system permease protein [Actinomadura viridis]